MSDFYEIRRMKSLPKGFCQKWAAAQWQSNYKQQAVTTKVDNGFFSFFLPNYMRAACFYSRSHYQAPIVCAGRFSFVCCFAIH